jgi:Zn finger protein HypA/HybF involved in hydrogenase expression
MESHKVKIEAKAIPCPKCSNGNLLPFLKAVHTHGSTYGEGRDTVFDHYEVYYRCSNCNHTVEGNSFF